MTTAAAKWQGLHVCVLCDDYVATESQNISIWRWGFRQRLGHKSPTLVDDFSTFKKSLVLFGEAVAHALNPYSLEAEAGCSQWAQGQPGLQGEFQGSQDCYKRNPVFKK